MCVTRRVGVWARRRARSPEMPVIVLSTVSRWLVMVPHASHHHVPYQASADDTRLARQEGKVCSDWTASLSIVVSVVSELATSKTA